MNNKIIVEEKLFFNTLKVSRNNYFAEYKPPISGYRFSTLQLIFINQIGTELIPKLMESESDYWFSLYPIPIMVSAFDDTGSLIHLKPVRDCDYLFRLSADNDKNQYVWRFLKEQELPESILDIDFLKSIYSNIPYKTGDQLLKEANKHVKEQKFGWYIFFIWAVIVPAIIAFLGFANVLIGILSLVYSLGQATLKGLKMTNILKPSAKEIEKRAKELKMKHYYYHCELNPEGFNRLKLENFAKQQKESIHKEAEQLKKSRNRTK